MRAFADRGNCPCFPHFLQLSKSALFHIDLSNPCSCLSDQIFSINSKHVAPLTLYSARAFKRQETLYYPRTNKTNAAVFLGKCREYINSVNPQPVLVKEFGLFSKIFAFSAPAASKVCFLIHTYIHAISLYEIGFPEFVLASFLHLSKSFCPVQILVLLFVR